MGNPCRVIEETIRPLTKHEIDRRIELVVSEVASASEEQREAGDLFGPRLISAGELVRRMRPFIVLN
jgi:hypothetical protein